MFSAIGGISPQKATCTDDQTVVVGLWKCMDELLEFLRCLHCSSFSKDRGDFRFTGVKGKHKTSIVSQETSNCAVYLKFILFQISAQRLQFMTDDCQRRECKQSFAKTGDDDTRSVFKIQIRRKYAKNE